MGLKSKSKAQEFQGTRAPRPQPPGRLGSWISDLLYWVFGFVDSMRGGVSRSSCLRYIGVEADTGFTIMDSTASLSTEGLNL
jgi:hypothetical protein